MFYLTYVFAELRRRRSRTILTALGLAVGVALVVTVNAVSSGLDGAQKKVLAPLTGVGTDMSVTRPIKFSQSGGPPPSAQGGGGRLNFRSIKPGAKINLDAGMSSQITFADTRVTNVQSLDKVSGAAGYLTLNVVHLSGTAPKIVQGQGTQGAPPSTGGQSGTGGPPGFGNSSIRNSARTVTGVDQTRPTLGPVTPSQILTGTYFRATGGKYQAIVSKSYAVSHSLKVGDTTALFKKTFTIVGISSAPLGSTASDLYVEFHTLQTLSGYTGKINGINVRAADSGVVTAVSTEIKKAVPGASVTTAADIASRIEGSLSDTRSLASKLGLALEILGLGAAVMIACVLTLASVSKRVREIGTLKAIGWSQWAVVRQISGESVVAGLLGGVIGVLAGLAAVVAINAAGWTLKASVASPSGSGGGFGFGRASSVPKAGSELVTITTHANWELIALAVALAVIGGLIAGAAGGLRAARLRPAAALRTVE